MQQRVMRLTVADIREANGILKINGLDPIIGYDITYQGSTFVVTTIFRRSIQ